MLRYLPLLAKNCWRNRRRTILTIASIGISMCLLGVMVGMFQAFYLNPPSADQAMRLITRNRVSIATAIPLSYQTRILQVPGVREVMIYNWFGGTYKDSRDPRNNFPRLAVEPAKLFKIFSEFRIPDDQRKAFEHERTACVIGHDLANDFNLHLGDRIHLAGSIYPGDFELTVRGIFDSPRISRVLFFDKEYVDQAIPEVRRGFVSMFEVRIDDPQHSGRIAKAIDDLFRNSTAGTKTESEQAFFVGFLALLGNVKMFLIGISAAIMFTILLVSANTMAMSVRERVREVGVLKTLGFSPGTILGLILGEACSISIAGGIIGYLISTVLMVGVSRSPFGGFLGSIHFFEPWVALVCVLLAGSIGLLSSLVPALGASRATIVDALRTTE